MNSALTVSNPTLYTPRKYYYCGFLIRGFGPLPPFTTECQPNLVRLELYSCLLRRNLFTMYLLIGIELQFDNSVDKVRLSRFDIQGVDSCWQAADIELVIQNIFGF